jgi:hypothetical protein
MMRTTFTLFAILSLSSVFVSAQDALVPTGGNVTGAAGEVSYSIGEAVYTSIETTAHTVIHGVQQPVNSSNLPVTGLQLVCLPKNGINKLEWKTVTEINSRYFSIERSSDGEKFEPIGKIAAAGTSTTLKKYVFDDNVPLKGRNLYRVKEIDMDGRHLFSNTVTANFDKVVSIVYPNPTSGNIKLKVNDFSSGKLRCTIVDGQGKILQSSAIKGSENLIKLGSVPAGTYFLNIIDRNNSIIKTFKILKNK